MSIRTRLARFIAALLRPRQPAIDADAMSLHDWADLPVHHPVADRAPC